MERVSYGKRLGLLLLGAAAFAVASPSSTRAAEPWLPLERSALARILAGASDGDAPAIRSFDDLYAEKREAVAADPAALARLQAGYDQETQRLAPATIWLLFGKNLPYRVAMAGEGERVHSLRIGVPVVNHGEKESAAAFMALAQLFTALYPEWPGAAEWPGQSLAATWDASPLMRKTPLENPDDVFIRHSAHGITSTTYGVPPDIVVYEVTVRERCIPVTAQGNPFKRIIC